MSGAILQGVPATTLDTDLWIDLPSRSYMRMINLARAQRGDDGYQHGGRVGRQRIGGFRL